MKENSENSKSVGDLLENRRMKMKSQIDKEVIPKQTEAAKRYYESLGKEKELLQNPTPKMLWKYIPHIAKQILKKTDRTYINDDQSRAVLEIVCLYFANDKRFLEVNDIVNEPSLSKGLMFVGNCGVGKTLFLQSAQKLFNGYPDRKFNYVDAPQITTEYNLSGDSAIERYKHGEWLIDDIGTETLGGHFAKKDTDVMKIVMEKRHTRFVHHGIKTHSTTNLNPTQIQERYGDRMKSRNSEMFNIVVITGEDRRK